MPYLSTQKAARALGLSERELRRGYYTGIYPGIKVGEKGGRLRFDPDQVKKAIALNRHLLEERGEQECIAQLRAI